MYFLSGLAWGKWSSLIMGLGVCAFSFIIVKDSVFILSWELGMVSESLLLEVIIDLESVLFFCSIMCISASVLSFSGSYMQGDKYEDRFYFLLVIFVFAMGLLTFSGNMFMLMIGWDGLGITSFLLVIYFQSKSVGNAGLITLLINRVGDVLMLLGMGSLILVGDWGLVLLGLGGWEIDFLVMIFILAAFTKSAQVPFSSWLPAAMAAPTPVSSLVHSSTLVTAGVYLLLRFKGSLLVFEGAAGLVLCLGSLTMCMAGFTGLFEDDFKKLVALSTLSQLGLMVSGLGLGVFSLTYFHMLCHAYFKALLFISTGNMIHSASGYQDLRMFSLPYMNSSGTSVVMLISNMSLMGFPFLSGFYSKDLLLEMAMMSSSGLGVSVLFVFGTLMTVLYTLRFILKSSISSMSKLSIFHHKDYDLGVFRAFDFLLGLAVLGGSCLNWLYLKWFSVFSFSVEMKNSILIMIVVSFFSAAYFLGLSGNMGSGAYKWGLGSMMGLFELSKSFVKLEVYNGGSGVVQIEGLMGGLYNNQLVSSSWSGYSSLKFSGIVSGLLLSVFLVYLV